MESEKQEYDMIEIITADITKLEVDAIVNAANCSLLGGGGVDGASHMICAKKISHSVNSMGVCKPVTPHP